MFTVAEGFRYVYQKFNLMSQFTRQVHYGESYLLRRTSYPPVENTDSVNIKHNLWQIE